MAIETLKSPNPRNRNGISVIKSKFLSVSSMNTLLAILKVTDHLCCQSMSSLHPLLSRLRSKVVVCWIPNIADFFFSLGRLIEDLERQLSSAPYDSSDPGFRILISAPWRVQKDTCNSAVKILWDLRLFRNREVHPFYVKSDWNPPVQPLEALERG